ncbi:hypothetical protein AWC38_SpisGene11709 [Stylophora pistillata]|uniref:HECT domain-containing protein n=1 Tax=Stylophora pistillata TaxID=50429 RepID=A0A2B4S570_STYPI|nr:hypothetical protein AWC38_SpisGene11709 [Stylophora pistillata]
MTPCYGKLITPKLAEGITLDAERVTRMAGQEAVYVSVSRAQRSFVLFSFGESDGRPDPAVVPHPCQDVAQPYCGPFPTEAETSHQNTELNDIETGSNSDIVYVSSEHVPVSVSVPVPQLPPKRSIQVHRLNIKKDLIDLFRDPLIMSQDIEIIVIDARGVKEVGRVDETCLTDKCLASHVKWDDEDEMFQLLEVFSNYNCRIMVNSENVSQVIEEIANKELLQKPQYIADCWKDIVSTLLPSFPDFAAISKRYEFLIPSTSKILSCLEENPESDGERESLKFLKRYFTGLDTPQKLSKFVRFISGSELMLFDAIQVNFTNLSGLSRRPIAHTCNTLLELSSTYQSFPELREEFSAILASDYWEMDIV